MLFQRVPRVLIQAQCSCTLRPPGLGFECETVYSKVKALRLRPGCEDYEMIEETIPLGCVTVMPANRIDGTQPVVEIFKEPQFPN